MASTQKSMAEIPGKKSSLVSRRWLVLLILLAPATVTLILGLLTLGPRSDKGMKSLVKAYAKCRTISPRLSGGFLAGAFNPAALQSGAGIDETERSKASEMILEAARNRDDTKAQMAYARLLMLEGRSKEALPLLQRLTGQAQPSPELLNDLGVCLLERGKLEDALSQFDKALKLDSQLRQSLFNRALCYRRLQLRDAARSDLSRLVGIERDRGWKMEARQQLDELSRGPEPQQSPEEAMDALSRAAADGRAEEAHAISTQSYEEIRRYALTDLLVEHLQAAAEGEQAKAASALQKMETVGDLVADAKGDRQIADLAGYLRRLPPGEHKTELELIKSFNVSLKELLDNKIVNAYPTFERLREKFEMRGNSVFEMSSSFNLAACHYAANRIQQSLDILKKNSASLETNRWLYLKALTICQLGITYVRTGKESLGIKYCKEALGQASDKPEVQLKALQYISVGYWRLGDLETALTHLRESTDMVLSGSPKLRDAAYNYLNIADIYRLRNNHYLALLYGQVALKFSEQAKDTLRAAQTSSFLAIEHAELNQPEAAEQALNLALDYLYKNDPSSRRAFTESIVLTHAGKVAERAGDALGALDYYAKAGELASRIDDNATLFIKLLGGRADAHIMAGQIDSAREDLGFALERIEKHRQGIEEGKHRADFLDAEQGAFDQTIALDIDHLNQRAEAFAISEKARARNLLDEIGRRAGRGDPAAPLPDKGGATLYDSMAPLGLAEVQKALPDDLLLLEFCVTSRGTYIFAISRTTFDVKQSPATTETIDEMVGDYLSDLMNMAPIEGLNAKAATLYGQIVGPVEALIGQNQSVCIVPDKALHFMPFAGLVDRQGRYLIESLRITYAPSASVLVRCLEEAKRKKAPKSEQILAVGDPAFDRDEFRDLQPLPEAAREAIESASIYELRNRVVLTREQATEARVRAALSNCDVAHLALHCLVDEKTPMMASLVLTGEGKRAAAAGDSSAGKGSSQQGVDDGLLFLGEVYNLSLPRTRLVILSACRSGLGRYYRGEGVVSLVRPFLASRVPTVVASLWMVDSNSTASLMTRFHAARKANAPGAGDALRAAQLYLAQDGGQFQHPYFWAPFIVVGSDR